MKINLEIKTTTNETNERKKERKIFLLTQTRCLQHCNVVYSFLSIFRSLRSKNLNLSSESIRRRFFPKSSTLYKIPDNDKKNLKNVKLKKK